MIATEDMDATTGDLYHGSAVRWTAPEVLEYETYSEGADIFSFAMVMIEVRLE